MKKTLLFVTLAFITAPIQAGVFKCATPTGFTYSEKPCAKDTKQLDFQPVKPTETGSSATGNSNDKLMQQMNAEKRARKLENEEKEEMAARNTEIKRKNLCAQARQKLDLYQRQIRIFKEDEKGERVYVEDDQRAAIIEEAKRMAEANCD
jgi:hypothetical protein